MKKLYRGIILVLMLFLLSGVSVFASNMGGGIGSGDGAGTGGSNDPNAGASGFSRNRTGYLFYATDGSGNVKSPVTFVPYNAKMGNNVNTQMLRARVTGTASNHTYTAGNIGTLTEGKFTKPPCTADGGSFGAELKNYLLSDSDGNGSMNAYYIMTNLWGSDAFNKEFADNNYYLCVEAVVWTGLVSGGSLYAYTSQSGAELYQTYGYKYLAGLVKQRLPKSGYMTHSWAGVCSASDLGGVPNGNIDLSILARRDSGFGMIAVCPDPPTEIPPQEPVAEASDDYLRANELNFYFPDFLKNGSDDGRSAQHYEDRMSMDMGALALEQAYIFSISRFCFEGGKVDYFRINNL